MQNNSLWSVANTLIFLCFIFTVISYIIDVRLFGMNSYFYLQGNYPYWVLQMFTSQFLHGWPLHLVMNAFFILYFWNVVEQMIGKEKMLLFFVWSSIFTGLLITFLTNANTVWISWFAMALLSYYTLQLYKQWNPQYTGGITALVINIAIWLSPGISFLGHAGGAVFGLIFYILSTTILKK